MIGSRLANAQVLRVWQRWQSTTAGQVASRSGLVQLKDLLANECKNNTDAGLIFKSFREQLEDMIESKVVGNVSLSRSNDLTAELNVLLHKTQKELNGDQGSMKVLPPSPYEILSVLINYKLARHSHFELVMKNLLLENQPKEVLGVWINYLESGIVTSRTNVKQFQYQIISSYVLLAYLLVEPTVNVDVLLQLLRLGDGEYKELPLDHADKLTQQLSLPPDVQDVIQKNLDLLIKQIMVDHKLYFLNEMLPNIQKVGTVLNLYEKCLSLGTQLDYEIVSGFLVRLAKLGKPMQAINYFNELTKISSTDVALPLKNSLLLVVSCMFSPPHQWEIKSQRIEAIWNSYIKTDSVVDISSYKALLEALINIGNIQKLKKVWEFDIPEELKNDLDLQQLHLLGLAKDKKTTFLHLKKVLPERITLLELVNELLLKIIKCEEPISEFDSFYGRVFKGKDSLKPNNITLAIQMYANYKNASDHSKFSYFEVVKIPRQFQQQVVEAFLEICPEIEPIRHLYNEVKNSNYSARCIGKFIEAEFAYGSWEHAETIFKEFVTSTKKKTLINKDVLDPIFGGFSNMMQKLNDPKVLAKLRTYWLVFQNVHHEISFHSMAKLVRAISELVKQKTNFLDDDLKFINNSIFPELVKMKIEKDFVIDAEILKHLKLDAKLVLPNELL